MKDQDSLTTPPQDDLDEIPNQELPKKKKKRSRKPKSKRGRNKPTGFEEYYVDAPMTPQEYATEQDLYNVSRPLIHRIEDALFRYQNQRRLENDRREVFLRYLAYGGVDVSPKMFEGADGQDLQKMDKEEILIARGQTTISHEHSKLAVDFNAVVKGYLTSYFPYFFSPESEDAVKLATVTIRNFLSYLLYHDVCPEYRESIEEARRSCDIADRELWKNQQFTAKGPGDFNTACSTLFGGFQRDIYIEDNQWKNTKDVSIQMTREIAIKVLKVGLAGGGSDELAARFTQMDFEGKLEAEQVEDIDGFEVTQVYPSGDATRQLYENYAPDLCPVGALRGKAFRDPGKPAYDLTPEERQAWEGKSMPIEEFKFFVESDLLQYCYPGMKVITRVWKLNCGLHYFEDIATAYSSIYTVLANDLMLGWKKPQDLRVGNDSDEDTDEEGTDRGSGIELAADFM